VCRARSRPNCSRTRARASGGILGLRMRIRRGSPGMIRKRKKFMTRTMKTVIKDWDNFFSKYQRLLTDFLHLSCSGKKAGKSLASPGLLPVTRPVVSSAWPGRLPRIRRPRPVSSQGSRLPPLGSPLPGSTGVAPSGRAQVFVGLDAVGQR
jgi:hypothetical protein